ncbi:hypothetical protein [Catenuloplanes atrovinosus]|uniref:Uncharacterized protein n=1 Tax=Catenuloplanes atrovinosus TaxID=137266 RepID=A0AAE3YXR3_9ACTN|nr:hypothetical protein [Catenuloplanes atrovinosus]MDR7280525.1 hypothetical protein [Catenuloplanes atrovinosus]
MFAIDCPQHDSRVLVTERRIRSIDNTEQGIRLDVECWCGRHVTLRTGRRISTGRADALAVAR